MDPPTRRGQLSLERAEHYNTAILMNIPTEVVAPIDTPYDYDLIVVGSGPAGEKAAIQAAKLHKHVAVIEQSPALGGSCIHTATLPSKTLREAVLFVLGLEQRSFNGIQASI